MEDTNTDPHDLVTNRTGDPGELDIDPVTLTVIWDRLVSICQEMGSVLRRTAKSEGVSSGSDFSTALFDQHGRLIAQGNFSPGHLGSMPHVVKSTLESIPPESLDPGDGIVLNDSRLGSGHLPDFFLISPIVTGGETVGYAVTCAHHIDVGGTSPGSQAVEVTEIYQEGLRTFPTRAVRGGRFEQWFLDLIRANVRVPDVVIGDLKAQQNANHRGGALFESLIDEYGFEKLTTSVEAILDHSEERIRTAVREIPDGEYSFSDVLDDVGPGTDSVNVAVTVTVHGDEMTFDYSDSDPQTESGINSYINFTRAYSLFVLKSVTDKDLHQNEGVMRPLSVVAPEGNFFNAELPAASGARPIINTRVVDVNMGALAKAVPDRVIAASSHWGNPNFGGVDPETDDQFVMYDIVVGGTGASSRKDGTEGLSPSFNLTNIPVEIHETRYPILVERLNLIQDSGGPGEHRGALGLRKDYTMLADGVTLSSLMDRTRTRPWGNAGGHEGDPGRTVLLDGDEETELHPKGTHVLDRGDTVSIRSSGGGGWGDPADRNDRAVLRDVALGYVSPEAAVEVYGVDADAFEG